MTFLTHHVGLPPPIAALRKAYSITSSARARIATADEVIE
jgi:hypothetical protein